jgi:hypothetical protein
LKVLFVFSLLANCVFAFLAFSGSENIATNSVQFLASPQDNKTVVVHDVDRQANSGFVKEGLCNDTSHEESTITGSVLLELASKKSLTKTLINKIQSGELNPNASLKAGDPSYTALVASLFLDPDITPQEIKTFIAEGSTVYSTPTWVVAASGLSRENLAILLEHNLDPLGEIEGRPLTYFALMLENFDSVNLLTEKGYPVLDNYQFQNEDRDGNKVISKINLYEEINNISNESKRKKILQYLDNYF